MHEAVTTHHNLNFEDSDHETSTDSDSNNDEEAVVAENREEDANEGDREFPVADLSKILEVQGIGVLQFIILHNTHTHTHTHTHIHTYIHYICTQVNTLH